MKTCFSNLGVFALLLALGWFAGLRLNLTESVPVGLYRETRELPSRGDLASFCLEPEAWKDSLASCYLKRSLLCPNGLQPLLKQISAMPGDRIDACSAGLLINGRAVPDSEIRTEDSKGRKLVSRLVPGLVPQGMALVLGRKAGSFDGRYFGLIPLRSCRKVIPLLTF